LLRNPAFVGTFSDLEILAALLAAAAHDIGHPGVNNTFLIASMHDTALLYNDVSVLENMHASTVSKLLREPGHNVLAALEPAEAKLVRKLMINMILGTDMVKHLEHVEEFKKCMMERVEAVEHLQTEGGIGDLYGARSWTLDSAALWLVRRGLLAAGTVLGSDPGFCCVRVSATRVAGCRHSARFGPWILLC
jgi:hypothetical protein